MSEPTPAALQARLLRIEGKVQGVSYRAGAEAEARRLGLRGWVRNRFDGSVEALVAGSPAAVESFIAWAWQGPAAAQVSAVRTVAAEVPESPRFERRASC